MKNTIKNWVVEKVFAMQYFSIFLDSENIIIIIIIIFWNQNWICTEFAFIVSKHFVV